MRPRAVAVVASRCFANYAPRAARACRLRPGGGGQAPIGVNLTDFRRVRGSRPAPDGPEPVAFQEGRRAPTPPGGVADGIRGSGTAPRRLTFTPMGRAPPYDVYGSASLRPNRSRVRVDRRGS